MPVFDNIAIMNDKNKKVLLSGIKPTGVLHYGNYFGMIKPILDKQEAYSNFLFIANLHALTSVNNKLELEKRTYELVAAFLAFGINLEKTTLYKQSDVPQVNELNWIFNCITSMPYLMRAHAYKDAEAKNKEINVGVFDYPLLMAADILIEQADIVPVGSDQKQHVEIARDTAIKFNRIFGEAFRLPEPIIEKDLGTITGTDGQKMSKSYNNTIPLFASKDELSKLVMSIPTDSKGIDEPKETENDTLLSLHKLLNPDYVHVENRYKNGGIGYKESKDILIDSMDNFISPFREKYEKLINDREYLDSVLSSGGKLAKERAEETMIEVRKLVGLS